MATTYSLRDLGLSPGQAKQVELDLELVPYRQAGIDYRPSHEGGTVPALLDVSAMSEGWSFRLRFSVDIEGPCSRCLEPARLHYDIDAWEVHDPTAEEDEEDLRSMHIDDQSQQLDVTSWSQELIGLEFPTRVLCRQDCAGLCATCGANRNEHDCGCVVDTSDSRWDKLKELSFEQED